MSTLELYEPISLEEMKSVRLMNRTDTKYITDTATLNKLLEVAMSGYYIQEIGQERILPYHTTYYDTRDYRMYHEHERGRKTRQKVRVREYVQSGAEFLEIKNKNNKGKTKKIRINYDPSDEQANARFIHEHTPFRTGGLMKSLINSFERITLVNKGKTERITIDLNLKMYNPKTDKTCSLENLAIIEIKKNGHLASGMTRMLRDSRIQPAKFSKYCMGLALTDTSLKQNRFKERIRTLDKICEIKYI